jgi:hypothetical protein
MDIGMQHGHRHAAWSQAFSMDTDIQHVQYKAYSMDKDVQYSMYKAMQHKQGQVASTRTCSADMYMDNDCSMNKEHTAWTRTCNMDMDIDILLTSFRKITTAYGEILFKKFRAVRN